MTDVWDTKDGRRRVRRDPPSVEEAVQAAQGLTDEMAEQIEIVASLMELSTDEARGAVLRLGQRKDVNRVTIAGHTFEHEIATAGSLGILGSLDINRGDALLGWDTDQFPNDLWTMTMSMYHVIKAGGLGKGGCNFDAKVRRQSFTPEDMVHAHVGGADLCARAFLTAAAIIEDGTFDGLIAERYSGWKSGRAADMLAGKYSLEQIEQMALENNINPQPRSGRQEKIENLLMRSIYSAR